MCQALWDIGDTIPDKLPADPAYTKRNAQNVNALVTQHTLTQQTQKVSEVSSKV